MPDGRPDPQGPPALAPPPLTMARSRLSGVDLADDEARKRAVARRAPRGHRDRRMPGPTSMPALRRAIQDGSVTTSRSPSSATSPPSARTTLTATAAPRSLGSSPSTIGAASGHDRLDRDPGARLRRRRDLDAAVTERPPRASAASDALDRGDVDLARARPRPWRRERPPARARASRPCRSDRLVAAALDPGRDRERGRAAATSSSLRPASMIPR